MLLGAAAIGLRMILVPISQKDSRAEALAKISE